MDSTENMRLNEAIMNSRAERHRSGLHKHGERELECNAVFHYIPKNVAMIISQNRHYVFVLR